MAWLISALCCHEILLMDSSRMASSSCFPTRPAGEEECVYMYMCSSATADGLQRLSDAADAWCAAVGTQASPAKTYMMQMTSPDSREAQWTCSLKVGEARQPLQVVLQAEYLGVTFQAGKGCLPTFAGLRSEALRAWAVLWQQYGRLACGSSLWLVLQLYQACVVPAGQRNDHGHSTREAWGILPLHGAARQAWLWPFCTCNISRSLWAPGSCCLRPFC